MAELLFGRKALPDRATIHGRVAGSSCQQLSSASDQYKSTANEIFNLRCGYDLQGSDLSRHHEDSFSACVDSCSKFSPRCFAASFDSTGANGYNNCFLKSGTGTSTKQSYPVDSAVTAGLTLSTEDCSSGNTSYLASNGFTFDITCGSDNLGQDTFRYHASSLQFCMEECAKAGPDCYGVAYESPMIKGFLNCYLKSSNGPLQEQSFVVDAATVVSRPSGVSATSVPSSTAAGRSGQSNAVTVPANTPTSSSSSSSSSSAQSHAWIAGVVIGSVVGLALISLAVFVIWQRSRRNSAASQPAKTEEHQKPELPAEMGRYHDPFRVSELDTGVSSQPAEAPVPPQELSSKNY